MSVSNYIDRDRYLPPDDEETEPVDLDPEDRANGYRRRFHRTYPPNHKSMNHISSYPNIYALGHRAITDILSGPVVVEEKVDGSQFSMSRIDGELCCRSKGQDLVVDAPEKMFSKAVATAEALDLHEGWTYRCEYLQSAKHNTLAYSRHPFSHLVLFDVETGPQCYLSPEEKAAEAQRIGLECVPLLHHGVVVSLEQIASMMQRESFLGGCIIEGVVIKNYALFTPDKKVAIAKLVCDTFKEKHATEWKASNPTSRDVVQLIISALRTDARWQKAVQHLREAGSLTDSPRDIGNLIKEAQADIQKEEREWIAESLLKHALPQILRGAVAGLPEWYKNELAQRAFATNA